MKAPLFFLALGTFLSAFAQQSYLDSIKTFRNQYVSQHEVVKGKDRQKLHFFATDPAYRVIANVELKDTNDWFPMATSGKMKQIFRTYAILHFKLNNKPVSLNLYQSRSLLQSEQYKNLLFLPFTDLSSGEESYEGGRYIDLTLDDIKNDQVIIDFNKAYNPYCAYVSGVYNCPVPPAANHLSIAVKAGEMKYDH